MQKNDLLKTVVAHFFITSVQYHPFILGTKRAVQISKISLIVLNGFGYLAFG